MDEVVLSVTAFGGAIFAAGMAFGGLLGYLLLPGERRARKLQFELDEVRRDSASYKANVSKHFHRTAELVSGLTNSYKAVYDHLAGGAQDLAEMPIGGHAIRFAETKLLVEDTDPAAVAAAPAAAANAAEKPMANPRDDEASTPQDGAKAA